MAGGTVILLLSCMALPLVPVLVVGTTEIPLDALSHEDDDDVSMITFGVKICLDVD